MYTTLIGIMYMQKNKNSEIILPTFNLEGIPSNSCHISFVAH